MDTKILCIIVFAFSVVLAENTGTYYDRAVIESCSGCSLNRLPDVKKFIFEDVPDYERVEYKNIAGAIPELVLYKNNEEIERLPLSKLTREECNELLVSKGFTREKHLKDEI
ncbi:selenoprotein M-like [Chelonus insularis]|uniref:selenoprotein M-like n=1 Tax=Chelonus insularis TaxID=460826 RepID=UPI00158EE541|nr:selenoprotein M-like [Chelonus insularis]